MANRKANVWELRALPAAALRIGVSALCLAACAAPLPWHAGSPLAGDSREAQARRLEAALAYYRANREPERHPSDPPDSAPATPVAEFAPAGMLAFVYSDSVPVVGLLRAALDQLPVLILARGEQHQRDAVALLRDSGFTQALAEGRVTVRVEALDSVWIRDYAPVFARDGKGRLLALDPIYAAAPTPTAERSRDDRAGSKLGRALALPTLRPPLLLAGGNLASDGAGRCFSSSEVLRANGGNRHFVAAVLRDYFGCERVTYLEPLPGPTTQHIDMFFRVARPGVLLLAAYPAPADPGTPEGRLQTEARSAMERNAQLLAAEAAAAAQAVEILRVPALPIAALAPGGAGAANPPKQRFVYPSFLNLVQLSTAAGELLLLPSYPHHPGGAEGEVQAQQVLRRAYPDARIVPIDAERLIAKQGALHCATWVIPDAVDAAPLRVTARGAGRTGVTAPRRSAPR